MALQHCGDALNWFLMALANLQMGEKDKARGAFGQAVAWMREHSPKHESFHQLWTEAAGLLGQPGPGAAEAAINRGIELAEQGKHDEAIAQFREAVRIDPDDADARHRLAITLADQGKLDEAVAEYRAAIRIQPDLAESHYNLGLALYLRGDLDQATVEYRAAIRLNPEFTAAHYEFGKALALQGKLDEATAEFREAIRIQPDDASAHAILGTILISQGNVDEASAIFRAAVRLKPDDSASHNRLAWALALPAASLPSDYAEALAHARKAAELAPRDVACVNTLALAEYRSGHWAESAAAAERAMVIRDGGNAEDWFILALAQCRKGENDDALIWFDKAVEWTNQNARENADLRQLWNEAAELLGQPMADAAGQRPRATSAMGN
jgi:tetratricopeptide (TPR) repeat protein